MIQVQEQRPETDAQGKRSGPAKIEKGKSDKEDKKKKGRFIY